MHALVIYNPVSGSKKWRDIPSDIREVLEEKSWSYDWFETEPKKRQNFAPFVHTNYDRIIVCGGDGTVSEVVTWMIQEKIKAPLVLVSIGSANLLARSLGLPFFKVKAMVREGITRPGKAVDVMQVNGKHIALLAVGRGYDAFLVHQTQRAAKRRWGVVAYLWSFLKTFLFYRTQAYKLTVDGKRYFVSAKSVVALNLVPAPQVLINGNDGTLNLFALGRFRQLRMWKAKKVCIKANKELLFQLDGEVFKSKTVNIEVLPGAVQVVYKKFLFQI